MNHSETSIIFAEASKLEFIAKAAGAIKKSVKQVVFWGSHACTDGASATVKKEASPDLVRTPWRPPCEWPSRCLYIDSGLSSLPEV